MYKKQIALVALFIAGPLAGCLQQGVAPDALAAMHFITGDVEERHVPIAWFFGVASHDDEHQPLFDDYAAVWSLGYFDDSGRLRFGDIDESLNRVRTPFEGLAPKLLSPLPQPVDLDRLVEPEGLFDEVAEAKGYPLAEGFTSYSLRVTDEGPIWDLYYFRTALDEGQHYAFWAYTGDSVLDQGDAAVGSVEALRAIREYGGEYQLYRVWVFDTNRPSFQGLALPGENGGQAPIAPNAQQGDGKAPVWIIHAFDPDSGHHRIYYYLAGLVFVVEGLTSWSEGPALTSPEDVESSVAAAKRGNVTVNVLSYSYWPQEDTWRWFQGTRGGGGIVHPV